MFSLKYNALLAAVCITTASAFTVPSLLDARASALRNTRQSQPCTARARSATRASVSMQLLGPDGKPMVFTPKAVAPGAAEAKAPKECHALLSNGYKYLDVRTSDEVAQGAPVDCVNVAAFSRTDDGLLPMSSTFLKLVAENFPDKSTKLVVGCAGAPLSGRSAAACTWLVDAGYSNIVNNNEGFVGWKNRGLPYKKAGSNSIF